jgi:NitT/TauT family transport system substrate-binding protein
MLRRDFLNRLAVVAALALWPQLAAAQDKVTLRLDWTALGYQAPFFLGVQNGTYKKAGLDVDVQEGKGSSNAISVAATGADDFAFADATTAARLIAQNVPVKVVMGIFQKSTLSLFFPAGAMSTPADLKGKRVALCPGDGLAVYLAAYLDAVKVPRSEVQNVTVDCSVKYTIVAQKQADTVASYGTAGKPLLQAVGIKEVAKFDYADVGIVLPSHGIITSNDKIQKNPDQVRRFVEATTQAWETARKNPDAAIAALVSARPLLKGKEAMLKSTLTDALAYLRDGEGGHSFGWQRPGDWAQATETLVKYTDMKKPASPEIFYTNAFVK